MTELEHKLNYHFADIGLLKTALTHSSYANEAKKDKLQCNERLEFLGDSVLGMTVAKYLYGEFPSLPEGKMTKLRAELVCEQSLAQVAEKLDLGKYLYLGKGEQRGGGRHRPSILADAVEAVLAAVMLDGGLEEAERIVQSFLLKGVSATAQLVHDNKTALQELVQKKNGQVLSYHLVSATGPDHQKNFTVEVRLNEHAIGTGMGRSKKEAEQAAAATALDTLRT